MGTLEAMTRIARFQKTHLLLQYPKHLTTSCTSVLHFGPRNSSVSGAGCVEGSGWGRPQAQKMRKLLKKCRPKTGQTRMCELELTSIALRKRSCWIVHTAMTHAFKTIRIVWMRVKGILFFQPFFHPILSSTLSFIPSFIHPFSISASRVR